MNTLGKFQSDSGSGRVQAAGTVQNEGDETKPLLSGELHMVMCRPAADLHIA